MIHKRQNTQVFKKIRVKRIIKRCDGHNFLTMESLILAQDERWRRASYMQVEREIHFGGWKVADG